MNATDAQVPAHRCVRGTDFRSCPGCRAYREALAQLRADDAARTALETIPAELADGPDEGDVIPGTEYAPGGIYDDSPGITLVADALQEVDQAGTEYGVPSAELLALRKLAGAVRSHGIGAELGQLRELRAALAACDREEDGALTALYHAVRRYLTD